jgi:hypothetical protein
MKMQNAAAVQSSTVGTQFHLLSFEGLDGYATSGGIASRITGLSEVLATGGRKFKRCHGGPRAEESTRHAI